jgi:hypothetical protein
VQPDCGYFSNCDDGDEGSSWSWGSVFETVVDFTPIIGDLKGIYEAVKDPTAVNIVSAGVGLAGPWGDAFAKSIKAAAKARKALKVDVPNRLPRDIAANPVPPSALPTNRPIGTSSAQNARAQQIVRDARVQGATDIRVNQQQVNAAGERVGINRPDVQFTTADGCRVCVEIDRPTSNRGPIHQGRILSNDGNARVILKTVN